MNHYKPPYPIPPGETILETMPYCRITRKYLAEGLGLSLKDTASLLKGELPLTDEMADALETMFKVSASFWRNLEKNYRRSLDVSKV